MTGLQYSHFHGLTQTLMKLYRMHFMVVAVE
jgi:hypothetical protein